MAYYGNGNLYNSGFLYGERLTAAPLQAVCVPLQLGEFPPSTAPGSGKVSVSWGVPVVPYIRYRIVRGRYGYPPSPSAGVLVFEGTSGTSGATFATEYLRDGDFAFYRMFSYSGSTWTILDEDYALVTEAGAGHDAITNSLPRMYTSANNDPMSPVDADNTLVRWLEGIGFWVDTFKTQTKALTGSAQDLHPLVLSPRLQGRGIPYADSLGLLTQRRVLNDQANFLPTKSTARSIRMLSSDVTGWHCTVSGPMNIIPTIQDVDPVPGSNNWAATTLTFLNSVGAFVVGASDTVSSSVVTAQSWPNSDPDFPNNLGYVRVLQCPASGTSAAQSYTYFDTTSTATKEATAYRLLRVREGQTYSAMMAVRRVVSTTGTPALANTTVSLTTTWYDRDFNVLRTSAAIPATQPAGALAWTYLTGGVTAPVGAVYMGYKVELLGDFKEVIHLGGIRFERMTSTRINLLLNAEPTAVASNWNTNANQVATWPKIAGGSLQMKALAAGTMSVVTDAVPVVNNRSYAVFAQVTTTASRTVNLSISYYDSTNTLISTSVAATGTINGTSTLAASVVAPYNAFTAAVIVEVVGAAINELAQVPKALLELTAVTPSLSTYFSGLTNGSYFGTSSSASVSAAPNPYRDPRLINITFDPVRSNYVTNPTLAHSNTTADGWVAAGSGQTLQVYTLASDSWSGSNAGSVKHASTAATQGAPWKTYTLGGSSLVTDFQYFTGSAYVRLTAASAATGVTARVGVFSVDSAGTFSTLTYGPWTTISNVGHVRLSATAQAAFNTSQVGLQIEVAGLAGGVDDFRFDAAQLEGGAVVTDYFDASTNSDAVWQGGTGNTHLAASHEYPQRKTKFYLITTILPDHVPPQTPYRVVLADDIDWANVRLR